MRWRWLLRVVSVAAKLIKRWEAPVPLPGPAVGPHLLLLLLRLLEAHRRLLLLEHNFALEILFLLLLVFARLTERFLRRDVFLLAVVGRGGGLGRPILQRGLS
eukprot:COSAG05_NODE_3944_length_1760_cov_19.908015_1_plen_103_part_00